MKFSSRSPGRRQLYNNYLKVFALAHWPKHGKGLSSSGEVRKRYGAKGFGSLQWLFDSVP